MDKDKILREHLINLLQGKGAHMQFTAAVKDFPAEWMGKKTENLPYTAWQVLEHMRIAQWDILDFCINPDYKYLKWPDDYWPPDEAPPHPQAWYESVTEFQKDLERVQQLVRDPQTDLFARIPHGEGQTYLREALLVADHNSYHLGQLVLLRKIFAGLRR